MAPAHHPHQVCAELYKNKIVCTGSLNSIAHANFENSMLSWTSPIQYNPCHPENDDACLLRQLPQVRKHIAAALCLDSLCVQAANQQAAAVAPGNSLFLLQAPLNTQVAHAGTGWDARVAAGKASAWMVSSSHLIPANLQQ